MELDIIILTAFGTVLFSTRCVSSARSCFVLFIRAWLDHSSVALGGVLVTLVCPALSFHLDFTDVSDLCYGLPTFGHFTIYLCHASLAQKRCKLFYVYLMFLWQFDIIWSAIYIYAYLRDLMALLWVRCWHGPLAILESIVSRTSRLLYLYLVRILQL